MASLLTLTLTLLALPITVHASSEAAAGLFRWSIPSVVRDLATLEVTSNYAAITRRRLAGSAASGFAACASGLKAPGYARLPYRAYSEVYNIKANIQGEDFELILDAGASDTWVIKEGFTCLNGTGQQVDESYCAFGPAFTGSYPDRKIKDENFNISYPNGASFIGDLMEFDITVAGLHVKNQRISLVNSVEEPVIVLDNVTSGLMGLAYSTNTHAYVGTDGSLDDFSITGTAPGDHVPYSPMFQTMIAAGLDPPLFSLALQRAKDADPETTPGGCIAFGGLTPVAFDPIFAMTPIEIVEFFEQPTLAATDFSYYIITPDAYVFTNKAGQSVHHTNQHPTIIDSGTLQAVLPEYIYSAYIDSIEPPPIKEPYTIGIDTGPFVPCNSIVPDLDVEIGGTIFNISSTDVILPYLNFTAQDGVEYCSLAVYGAPEPQMPVIGTTLLQNVVAVFDVGAIVMGFASHTY